MPDLSEEKYKYIRLTSEDAAYFKDLDPYEKLGLLNMPYGFALGALRRHEYSLEPIGLLVGTICMEQIIIEWLLIKPEHQFEGHGEELLDGVFKLADAFNIPTLKAVISPGYEKEPLLKGAKRYFEERLFSESDQFIADTYLSVETLRLKAPGHKSSGNGSFIPLSKMSGEDRGKALNKLSNMTTALFTYPPVGFVSALDYDLSMISVESGKITSALLIAQYNGALLPVYYYAKNDELSQKIVNSAIEEAYKKYGAAMEVVFMARQPESAALIEKITGVQEKGEILKASVEEYKRM